MEIVMVTFLAAPSVFSGPLQLYQHYIQKQQPGIHDSHGLGAPKWPNALLDIFCISPEYIQKICPCSLHELLPCT